jgi:UDP-N-acetylmuramoyl-tripeptide--D-alanyl-D-alanine ligase
MTAAEVARVVGGRIVGFSERVLTGAGVDSRLLREGGLFVALPGVHHDGHEFVPQALRVGGAALVREGVELGPPAEGTALIVVDDPLAALWKLARVERQRRGWEIVTITGSVGKTTVKDFLAKLMVRHRRTGWSEGNRNNTLGLPGQLLGQPENVELFVAEAGMSSAGELDTLGAILEPIRLLLYTRIAPVHTEFFPDIDGIVRAKAELLPYVDRSGTLVVNADDPRQQGFAKSVSAEVLSYGGSSSDARIEALEDRGLLGTSFDLVLPDGRAPIELDLPGRHQAENLLAAAAAASALGVSVDEVAVGARDLEAAPHRGRIHRLPGGITLVDDCYNASPLAVERLLELLVQAPGRRVAVLGEMLELGALTDEAHRSTGVRAAAACDLLVAVGADPAHLLAEAARAAGLDQVRHVDNAERATELLRELLEPGDVVLIKGSLGVGLIRTVEQLTREEAA